MAQRTIIEHPDFTKTRDAMQLNARRFDEIMEGVGAALATRPTYFPQVPNTRGRLRSLRTEPFLPGEPSYLIYFSHNNKEVILEDLYYAYPEDGAGLD